MALSDSKAHNLYKKLKYNFLFNNDINCIHILLNLYEIENNINNIFPKYVSLNYLRRQIRKLLKDRRGNYLIAYNLGQLIHEDINRLELFLYLEGYKQGYLNIKIANHLESKIIKYFSVSELYNMKYLIHFDSTMSEIKKIKSKIFNNLKRKGKTNEYLDSIITNYTSSIIKPKVLSLNKHLDKQLAIDYNSLSPNIKEDEALLTLEELDGIYKEVIKIILRNGQKLYYEAYWNGLNDRVLKRYK